MSTTISKEQHDELCVSYASMMLFDGEHEITSDAINAIVSASGNEVEPYWPTLFASLLSKEGKILDLISSGGAAAGAAAAGGEQAKEEVNAVEEEEEVDMGGGMDMFGDEDY